MGGSPESPIAGVVVDDGKPADASTSPKRRFVILIDLVDVTSGDLARFNHYITEYGVGGGGGAGGGRRTGW